MKEFILFIRRQGVVGLAIGFLMGGAVSKLVTSFVQDILQPLIGLIFGTTDGIKDWMLGPLSVGSFLAVLADFVIIAAIIFFVFKGLRLEKIDKKDC